MIWWRGNSRTKFGGFKGGSIRGAKQTVSIQSQENSAAGLTSAAADCSSTQIIYPLNVPWTWMANHFLEQHYITPLMSQTAISIRDLNSISAIAIPRSQSGNLSIEPSKSIEFDRSIGKSEESTDLESIAMDRGGRKDRGGAKGSWNR
jgi:hypothetical protein